MFNAPGVHPVVDHRHVLARARGEHRVDLFPAVELGVARELDALDPRTLAVIADVDGLGMALRMEICEPHDSFTPSKAIVDRMVGGVCGRPSIGTIRAS